MNNAENNHTNEISDRLNQMSHLICNHKSEIMKVNEIITEAVDVLYNFAVNDEDYYKYSTIDEHSNLYFKKVNNTEVGKIELIFPDTSKLEKIIGIIWDENGARNFDPHFIEGKIIRIYDQNLILVQQSYKGTLGKEGRYFYILAHKKKINKNTYLIACLSLNINDNNKKCNIPFTNPFINSANSFTLDIECDEKIKNSSLRKMHINLSGYFIKREESYIKLTYISSIDLGTSSLIPQFIIRKIKANKMLLLNLLRKNI
ncbi:fam-a protein [Plasmodium gallinaceum]|uniref:Fam-a protein n=1 Tax=Plasmodium gallinaceum TaxID=5849 RepID=A0A1J1GQY1_PLAGA|nr:fam-a protein [Plasmodium gallinaceum]CRG94832.1 fam-a protein [Plasmodium gallinaceum]